jgi:hypothetical protein
MIILKKIIQFRVNTSIADFISFDTETADFWEHWLP